MKEGSIFQVYKFFSSCMLISNTVTKIPVQKVFLTAHSQKEVLQYIHWDNKSEGGILCPFDLA